jgi:hypothetical protein
MYSSLLAQLHTVRDLAALRQEVELLRASAFGTKEKGYPEVLKTQVRAWVKTAIEADLKASTDSKELEKYFTGLIAELDKLTTLQLTVAFEPTLSNIEKISGWVTTNVGPNILLEFQYKPDLLGGSIVIWNGKYYDGSMSQKVDQALATTTAKHISSPAKVRKTP